MIESTYASYMHSTNIDTLSLRVQFWFHRNNKVSIQRLNLREEKLNMINSIQQKLGYTWSYIAAMEKINMSVTP